MNAATIPMEPTQEAMEERGPHWVSRAAFPLITALYFANEFCLWAAVHKGWYWLAAILALSVSHLMHGQLIGFHEASHGMLRKNRLLNEIDGVLLGALSFTSFSLYRVSHQSHHAHLGTERDEELWPFVVTKMPRWRRIVAAVVELNLGIVFTPYLFFRTFLRANSPIRSARIRRRIWREVILMMSVWALVIAAVTVFGVWKYFLWMHLGPAVLAANLQSWRKYIEHVGMLGSTVNSCTRTIVAEGPVGKLIALTLLHEPYHGVHHRYSGMPHAELPAHTAVLEPKRPDDVPPFPSYGHAFVHLIRRLADPRVGAQWRTVSSKGS